MINRRSSGNHIISEVMKNANGIGQSKATARAASGVKGQNGHNVSTKAHSISETQNLRSITTQYVNFVKENYEGKVSENLNNDTAKDFINHKAEEVGQGTLNTYISTLAKVADNLNELGVNSISRDEITDYRETLKEQGKTLQSEHNNRAYENPEEVVRAMEATPYSLTASLQYEAGLRADDALNSDKWTLNEDNTLHIEGSKGGVDYTTSPLSDELAQRVSEAIENGFRGVYDDYRATLKEITGEDYEGTHGLRYNYAQERVEELQEQGLTYNEALAETSLEMGHSREEITEHYLK